MHGTTAWHHCHASCWRSSSLAGTQLMSKAVRWVIPKNTLNGGQGGGWHVHANWNLVCHSKVHAHSVIERARMHSWQARRSSTVGARLCAIPCPAYSPPRPTARPLPTQCNPRIKHCATPQAHSTTHCTGLLATCCMAFSTIKCCAER